MAPDDDDDFDFIAAGILAEDVGLPTALAAAYRPQPVEQPAASRQPKTFAILILGGLGAFIVWLLLR